MAHHSRARKQDLRAGKAVWIISYDFADNKEIAKQVILKQRIANYWGDEWLLIGKNDSLFPGDHGVIGCAYDNRCCQVFLNKRACEHWVKVLNGRWRNFVDQAGKDIPRKDNWYD